MSKWQAIEVENAHPVPWVELESIRSASKELLLRTWLPGNSADRLASPDGRRSSRPLGSESGAAAASFISSLVLNRQTADNRSFRQIRRYYAG